MYKKITVRTRFLAGLIALVLILSQTANSQAADPVGTITTIAGTGNRGSTGDGGPATLAQLGSPFGMAVDTLGNIYIADHDNRVIRKVDPNGIITTVAGTGGAGFAGDGGPATAALLDAPNDVAVDVYGNLYIADLQNRRIRKVNLSGIITTIAGNGSNQSSGDGGPATAAGLNFPHGISVDPAGNLYIASPYDARIRKVDTNGIISTGNSVECLEKLRRLVGDFSARLAQSGWCELLSLLVHIRWLLELLGLHAGFSDRPAVLVPSEQQAELLVVAPKELEKAAQLVVDLAALPGWLEQLS